MSTTYLLRVDKVEDRAKAGEPPSWYIVCGMVALGVGHDRPDLAVGDTLELRKREPHDDQA
jgi:hypothetical protein